MQEEIKVKKQVIPKMKLTGRFPFIYIHNVETD